MVIWLCGLSASGKTTIGCLMYDRVKPKVPNLILLDGEDLRIAFGNDLGHDQEGRRRNSVRIANLCQLLDRQGIHVICCAMTIAPEAQVANRKHIKEYYEVLLDVSIEVLEARDPKGIYRRVRVGQLTNVCGVDIPYVAPVHPHLVINNNPPREDLTPLVDQILAFAPLEQVL